MPGYFSQPKGITVDAEGRLYVVDAHFEAVQVFDPQGRVLMSFGREGQGPGEFWLPVGICADDSGMLWIADSYNRRVQVFRILPEEGTP
jgi:sugar lactone lactonase YvrE